MGIPASRFSEIRVTGIFIDDDDVYVSAAEREDVIVESVPLSAHDGEGTIDFLFVDDDSFLVDVLEGGSFPIGVACDHLMGVPELEGSIFHSGEDQSVRMRIYLDHCVLYFSPKLSQATQRKGESVYPLPTTLSFLDRS